MKIENFIKDLKHCNGEPTIIFKHKRTGHLFYNSDKYPLLFTNMYNNVTSTFEEISNSKNFIKIK